MNVFGYDFYKECIERGSARVRDLGPVLGALHPVTADNVHRLRAISGLDEISFHMSGTEAVMQAVRLARYHTGAGLPGPLLRRLPRLVGRRAARGRQPVSRARYLHPGRHERAQPGGAAQPQGHCLRAGQSAAGAASERRRAVGFDLSVTAPRTSFDRAAYTAWLQEAAPGLHRSRHRADFR